MRSHESFDMLRTWLTTNGMIMLCIGQRCNRSNGQSVPVNSQITEVLRSASQLDISSKL